MCCIIDNVECLAAFTGASPVFSFIESCSPAIQFLGQLLFGDCLLTLIKKYWRSIINMRTLITVAILLLMENG